MKQSESIKLHCMILGERENPALNLIYNFIQKSCQGVEVHFNWKRDNRDPGSGDPISCVSACCDYCYHQDLTTEIHFLPEVPTFTITRSQPTNEIALHNTACQGTTTPWQFTVQNTSAFTALPAIEVRFSNEHNSSLSIISEGSIQTPSCLNCSIAPVPLVYPQEV